ncbi:MAG: hypothetical protein ABJF50_01020 [Paracoccaceae bacterium]
MRTQPFLLALVALAWLSAPAHAACFADYKAKRDNPLQLHYGVIKIDSSPCAMSNKVQTTVAGRLKAAGWQLLQVQSVFDDSGLERRKPDAGQYFLRF